METVSSPPEAGLIRCKAAAGRVVCAPLDESDPKKTEGWLVKLLFVTLA